MTSQVIFKIDKKLKDLAMKKAQNEGIPLASVLKMATKAFVSGHLTLSLIGSEEFNAATQKKLKNIQKDADAGKNMSPRFSSAEEAVAYLEI
jgi:antitoxin component of RelBE/YafQ-DinJ toxin-antitoxin module